MKSIALILSILVGLLFENQASALTLKDEVLAYNKGDYNQSIAIGHQLAKENPSDPQCHYYLANSYSRSGEIQEAMREYSACLNLTDDPLLRSYCDQALMFLSKIGYAKRPAASNPRFLPRDQAEVSYMQQPDNPLSAGKAKIAEIKDAARKAIDSLPISEYNQQGVKKDGHPIIRKNPEYRSAVKQITQQEQTDTATMRLLMQNGKESVNSISPNNSRQTLQYHVLPGYAASATAQYNAIPGYMKPTPYQKTSSVDSLFNASPLPPPPFPTSAKQGAEEALHKKIN